MGPVSAVSGSTTPYAATGIGATQIGQLLAAELNPTGTASFGNASTIVQTSAMSRLLSAAGVFQDQVSGLANPTAASNNAAGLAANAQMLVNAFNTLQSNIAGINAAGNVPGGAFTAGVGLGQTLDGQAQANYANGGSALTNLAQIGIVYQPGQGNGSGRLSINPGILQSAFNSDPAGAIALLGRAAGALADLAGNFASQVGGQSATLSSLMQINAFTSSLGANGQSNALFNGGLDLAGLLGLQSLNQGASNGGNTGLDLLLALNNYMTVSQLLG